MTMPRTREQESGLLMDIYDLPVMDTPFTRLSEHWQSHQHGLCADFEMDYSRCASRVGLKNVQKLCSEYLTDWKECAFKLKSVERYHIMQAERKKQGLGFEKPPQPDSVNTVY